MIVERKRKVNFTMTPTVPHTHKLTGPIIVACQWNTRDERMEAI